MIPKIQKIQIKIKVFHFRMLNIFQIQIKIKVLLLKISKIWKIRIEHNGLVIFHGGKPVSLPPRTRFLFENWWNLIRIQHGALELTIWLTLSLKIDGIQYESSLELKSSLFDWFLIENWSNLIRIQPEARELIIWLILNWKLIKFDMNLV